MVTSSTILKKVLDPLDDAMGIETARRFASLRLDDDVQELMTRYAAKSNEGNLTPEEGAEYDALISATTLLSTLRARARNVLRSHGVAE
jgi:hypothetical protein